MENSIAQYLSEVQSVLSQIEPNGIFHIVETLHRARMEGRTIFLIGNGGSSATASHWANDLCKGASHPDLPRLRAIALTDNVPLITAWANDTAYENIFREQLANFLQSDDVVIGISGSGNSPNVLNAMTYAHEQGAQTIGLTGFRGGRLKDLVALCLIVPSDSMEQIEDVHMIVAHTVSKSLRQMATERLAVASSFTLSVLNEKK